jgi:predicted  nucleic acid-binding Zn-ribbon protein
MKANMLRLLALITVLSMPCASVEVSKDRTITKVVKLLQEMLEKSQKEGDEERVIYAKFKCYCDQNEAEKTASIKSLTEQIALLESKIAEIQGDTGTLSSDCAELKTKMADNKAARDEATSVRKKEKKAFEEEEADLEEAIKDMKEAIEVLSKVGADQTDSKGAADNKKFMAGFGDKSALVQGAVKTALRSVSAIMTASQRKTAAAFLQAPFTGTYTSQSAEVMGIIKNMRDTFIKDLADARKTEKNSQEAYDEFMKIKEEAFDNMKKSYEEKQKYLGDNDSELSAKKSQLAEAEKQKASDEEFLDALLPMCEEKAKNFETRKVLRANEEAAIAEAISILNSDEAFATFGTTDATKTGKTGFLQLRSVHKHVTGDAQVRQKAQQMLQQAASDTKSSRLSKVVSLLRAENPFETVLDEIDKMLELIDEEGKQDKTNLDWCNKERDENEDSLKEKKAEILKLEDAIDKLTKTIEDPKTGLKKQIEETEISLVQNKDAQTKETATRTEENLAYQADVRNLVSAESILKKAIKVLKAYYDDLADKLAAGGALVQEDPKPPEAEFNMEGQSSQGGDVIKMLEFILSETVKEETEAHSTEEKAQADYEDSMTKLKEEEAKAEKNLADLQETLAEKEKELLDTQEDLKKTTEDKEAVEAYLLKIKPGCDFITKNFDLREKNRKTEKGALEKAIKLIKGTPEQRRSFCNIRHYRCY